MLSKFFKSKHPSQTNLQSWGMVFTERDAVIVIPAGAVELDSPAIEIGDEGQPSKMVGYRVKGSVVTNEVETVFLKPVKNQTMLRNQKSLLVVAKSPTGTRLYCGLTVKKAVRPAKLKRVDGIGYPGAVAEIYDTGEKSGIWRGAVRSFGSNGTFVELSPPPNLRKDDYVLIVGEIVIRNGAEAYEKGSWLHDKARYRIFGSTYKYFCEASQTAGVDDADVVAAVQSMVSERVGEYAQSIGIKEHIQPLIMPTDHAGRFADQIAFIDALVEKAKPQGLEGFDLPDGLDVEKLPVTPLKAYRWEAQLAEGASGILLFGLDDRVADDKLQLYIRKDYTKSIDGIPSRIGLKIEYNDGGVDHLLLGEGPHEKFLAHVTDPDHKVFIVKGDIGGDDARKKVLMLAKPVFC